MSFLINRLITKNGISATIRVRTATLDSETGDVSYSYDSTIKTTMYIQSLTGWRETYWDIGITEDADYFGLLKGTTSINKGDRILFGDIEVEVKEIVDRQPPSPDFKEIIMDKV